MAALYTQLAALEDMQTDEGLKRACSYFQYASGVTGFLKNEMALHPKITASPDLSPSNLSSLHLLMLAQAQECFWRKAALGTNREGDCEKLSPDPPPPSVDKKLSNEKLAKISEKCAELYQSALTENSRAIEPFPQVGALSF